MTKSQSSKSKQPSPGKIKAASGSKASRPPLSASDDDLHALLQAIDLDPPKDAYQGPLKKPITRASKWELMIRDAPARHDQLEYEENRRLLAEQIGKLFLLLDHFGIPRDSRLRWFVLAFQLARRHVPGLSIKAAPQKSGPKPKWELSSDIALVTEVFQMQQERKRGVADAIRALRKRKPDLWGQFSEAALRNRYHEIRSRPLPSPDGDLIDNLRVFLGVPARYGKHDNSDG